MSLKSPMVSNDFFSSIEIYSKNTNKFRIFPFYGADYEDSITDNLLIQAVYRKEKDLQNYKSIYDECWLMLILPDTYSIKSGFFLPDNLEQ